MSFQTPEVPQREMQQEIVLSEIKNPTTRALIKDIIPSGKNINSDNHRTQETLGEVLKTDGGNTYRYIFGLAATAKDGNQLANAFGAIDALSRWGRSTANQEILEHAQNDFLGMQSAPDPSDGARALQGKFIVFWNQNTGSSSQAIAKIGKIDEFMYTDEDRFARKHWAEAYLFTVIDPHTPLELRKELISDTSMLRLGNLKFSSDVDPRYDRGASFWQSVKPSWVMPEAFGSAADVNIDPEILRLRGQVVDLQRQVRDSRPTFEDLAEKTELEDLREDKKELVAENQRLRRDLADKNALLGKAGDQIERLIRENEGVRRMERRLPNPLNILNIGTTTWANADPQEREKILRSAYRDLARQYHYQVSDKQPNYDPIAARLSAKVFGELTEAYNFLEKNFDVADHSMLVKLFNIRS